MEADGHSEKQTNSFSAKLAKLFSGEKQYKKVTIEEILTMVDVGEQEGILEKSKKKMINNIFEFADVTVEEVMTHRVDLVAVEEQDSIQTLVYYAIHDGFSRIPVYKNDIDNIVGIVYVKDLLSLIGCESLESYTLRHFIREVLYIPETTKCYDLFKQFTEKKQHIAVVVDEYGGTAGVVTMEDLVESIVGNIQDEYDDEEEKIKKINDTTYILEGSADVDDVSEILGLEIEENSDYDTLGGFIIDCLGRIPDEGEHPVLQIGQIEFTVLVVADRHISKVRAVRLPKPLSNDSEFKENQS